MELLFFHHVKQVHEELIKLDMEVVLDPLNWLLRHEVVPSDASLLQIFEQIGRIMKAFSLESFHKRGLLKANNVPECLKEA